MKNEKICYNPDRNSEYTEVTPIPVLNLPELRELRCMRHISSALLFYCEPVTKYRGGCVHCGSLNHYIHGYAQDRLVHDISMGTIHVDVLLKTPRYRCNDCGATFVHRFSSVAGSTQFTMRLYDQIKERALAEQFSFIAKEFGASTTTISKIFREYGKELDANREIVAPRVLGIDEKHITHKARGVFVDVEKGTLLEMTKRNDAETVISAIESFPNYSNIQIVTIDMHKPYVSAVQICLPNARIVVDKYHVVQLLYKDVAACKTKIVEQIKATIEKMPEGEEKTYKKKLITQLGKNVYLFKFGNTKLSERKDRIRLMTTLCKTFPELNTLRILKCGAECIYASKTRQEAEQVFSEWASSIPNNKLFSDIQSVRKTIMNWKEYIFNYFDEGCRYTNAATEGINNRIEALNRAGRGYEFESLRIKALYSKSAKSLPSYEKKKSKLFNFRK